MPKSIVNQPTPSQVSGRLATWHRLMEEAGLQYADLQTPIDDPDFRVRLVQFWQGGAAIEIKPREEAAPSAPKPESKPQPPTHPPIGEWFNLSFDAGTDMTPNGWTALPHQFVVGKRIYRVKLIELGYQPNLDAVAKAARKNEKEPTCVLGPGQAREAFKVAYPRHSGRSVVFGGNEWQVDDRDRHVAFLDNWRGSQWSPGFRCSGSGFSGICLWLVVEQIG